MDRVKYDFLLPSHAPNWLKDKIVCFAKIWKPPRQHFGFFEDWRNFGNPQKLGKFLKLGVALILPYLLTKLAFLVRPGPKTEKKFWSRSLRQVLYIYITVDFPSLCYDVTQN